MKLAEYLADRRRRIDHELARLLPAPDGPATTVAEAMRYAVLGGGKRVRPVLVLAACEACGGDDDGVVAPACAVELIHTYSLIHDDLPAMDDDDLRRGRPTVHRVFDDAVAILAGDALLTLAFEVLASRPSGPEAAVRRTEAVIAVARGAGIAGMVGGQIADVEAERRDVRPDALRWIHEHKTGAMFAASCELGAIHAGAPAEHRRALARYGEALGLAFQIADDLLDVTGSRESLGKTPGKDRSSGKATYPRLLGIEAAQDEAAKCVRTATEGLRESGLLTPPLQSLLDYAVNRSG